MPYLQPNVFFSSNHNPLHCKQEALAKSLPSVPAAALQLFFGQVSSGIPQPLPPHPAASRTEPVPRAPAAADPYLHHQQQQQQHRDHPNQYQQQLPQQQRCDGGHAADPYLQHEDRQSPPQQEHDDTQPGWRAVPDGFEDDGRGAGCRQHLLPPQWPPPQRYQV